MSLLANVLGFSAFGLAARFGQLGIQKRNPFENLWGHAASTILFGYLGYLSWDFDQRFGAELARRRVKLEEYDAKRRAEAPAATGFQWPVKVEITKKE